VETPAELELELEDEDEDEEDEDVEEEEEEEEGEERKPSDSRQDRPTPTFLYPWSHPPSVRACHKEQTKKESKECRRRFGLARDPRPPR
jgi:hypothetical protein